MREINGPAGPLALNDGGAGDLPVFFVHGLAGHSGQWSQQLDGLRRSRRAVALDLRGHGRSSPPRDHDYSIRAMAEDVAAGVKALSLERFVLVGHSMGGAVAIEYAGSHPDGVAGLLLVDAAGDWRQVPRDQVEPFLAALGSDAYDATMRRYWESILRGAAPGVAEEVMAAMAGTPKQTVVSCLKGLLRYDPLAALHLYRGRVLSVISSLNNAPWSLHHLQKGLATRLVEGTSHWLQLDAPETFHEILDEFLATVA